MKDLHKGYGQNWILKNKIHDVSRLYSSINVLLFLKMLINKKTLNCYRKVNVFHILYYYITFKCYFIVLMDVSYVYISYLIN